MMRSITVETCAPWGKPGTHEVVGHLPDRRVDHQVDRDQHERAGDEDQADALEAPEAPGAHRSDDDPSGQDDRRDLGQSEIADGEGHADELGDDGQGVQDEEVDDAERPPELAEPLENQSGMADAGHGAESKHHLLTDVEHRDQQQQGPQQVGAVVLSGLGVGAEGPGVVVTHHDDQPRTHDGQQGLGLGREASPRSDVPVGDGAHGPTDVTDVGRVENGRVLEWGGVDGSAHRRHLPET